jgi:RNase_H superfamily
MPRGFEPVPTPFGDAWRLAEVLPPGRVHGVMPPVPHGYLDTETTGLSGGTGTQVFAAAVCRPAPAGLELIQLFLPDPAGEAAFLHLLQDELSRTPGLATYNGSRFDLPLLRTRWVMARMPGDLTHPAHLDLLTLTRALLRQRLDSCTLRYVEERLLGFEREADLPGALVPAAYLQYLRLGWAPTLELALSHNRQDVLSLFYLHARLLLRLAGEDPRMEGDDWLALGRHLLRCGRRADGWRALRRAAEHADGPGSVLAAVLLARALTRRKLPMAAERLLAALHQRMPGETRLVIVRARLLEWSLHRPSLAHELVVTALAGLPVDSPHLADLERRAARLQSKLPDRRSRAAIRPAQQELFPAAGDEPP